MAQRKCGNQENNCVDRNNFYLEKAVTKYTTVI